MYDGTVHWNDLHCVIIVQKTFFTSRIRSLAIDHNGFIWHGFDKAFEFIDKEKLLNLIHYDFMSIYLNGLPEASRTNTAPNIHATNK